MKAKVLAFLHVKFNAPKDNPLLHQSQSTLETRVDDQMQNNL